MSVYRHYERMLGNYYTWIAGDFEQGRQDFTLFARSHGIIPSPGAVAIDLGSAHGIQSLALADLGFTVKAIDFNPHLIEDLNRRRGDLPIETIQGDILNLEPFAPLSPELIICCGDTIAHLESLVHIETLMEKTYRILKPGGRVVLTFRDYTDALEDTQRFIPVKSDPDRIFTCMLEYFPDRVRVTDLVYEREQDHWTRAISSYYKIRVSSAMIGTALSGAGFTIVLNGQMGRMAALIGQKNG
ncbi:MAG: class I SAM-dependent methyltransferase [Candidatus Delongbacteria bacterium]|nr:class I SAM-dependent methyltransferase [Candidatus Delongbacteria bacterium]